MQLFLATGAPAAEMHARNRGQASFACPRSSDLLWARVEFGGSNGVTRSRVPDLGNARSLN